LRHCLCICLPLGGPGGWVQEATDEILMTKGARPPGPVFLPVVSHLRASRWPHGGLVGPLFTRSLLGTMYRATAWRMDRKEVRGISYDYNRGLGYNGGPAT